MPCAILLFPASGHGVVDGWEGCLKICMPSLLFADVLPIIIGRLSVACSTRNCEGEPSQNLTTPIDCLDFEWLLKFFVHYSQEVIIVRATHSWRLVAKTWKVTFCNVSVSGAEFCVSLHVCFLHVSSDAFTSGQPNPTQLNQKSRRLWLAVGSDAK